MKISKTNAVRFLDTAGVTYGLVSYSTDDGAIDGLSVAEKTGQDPNHVFKTLVVKGASGGLLVFCLPVTLELDLKQAARAAGEKSVAMLPQAQLLPATGYVHGGVSPLGMKKTYPTFLHHSAQHHATILVSAGRVGLQLEVSPGDLLAAAGARWFGGP